MKKIVGLTTALAAAALYAHGSFAAEKEMEATSKEKAFIMKAANGGMTEVELGKVAADKGLSQEVKDFGSQMVTDHSKANEQLKEVAGKLKVEVPTKVDALHQAKIDKMSALSGAAFDSAYVKEMVGAHEKDIAEFEKSAKNVTSADLKKFIEETVPTMRHHLDMIKKFDQAKKG
jgi:putative membrane protein